MDRPLVKLFILGLGLSRGPGIWGLGGGGTSDHEAGRRLGELWLDCSVTGLADFWLYGLSRESTNCRVMGIGEVAERSDGRGLDGGIEGNREDSIKGLGEWLPSPFPMISKEL
jgi:hypothetical protein